MRWAAAAILGVMLYVIWPYYTLFELSRAIQSHNAATINRLVDWEQVRVGVKAQIQARLEQIQKAPAQREFAEKNPRWANYGNAMAQKFANSLIDHVLTPEGMTRLMEGSRDRTTAWRQASARPPSAGTTDDAGPRPGSPGSAQQASFWQRIHFAFFVSPIHFRFDLRDPARGATESTAPPTLTVMMIFKGTGWQVYDVRLPGFDELSPNVSLAPN
jgi:Protein of unknown function (DUF2939)